MITETQFADALVIHQLTGVPFSQLLIDLGYLLSSQVIPKIAEQIGTEFVDLAEYKINGSAVALVSEDLCRKHTILPIDLIGDTLLVAMCSPDDVMTLDDLQMVTGHQIKPVIATKEDIEEAINRCHQLAETISEDFADLGDSDVDQLAVASEDAPVIKLVNLIISQAVEDRASDIHIEPQEHDLRVRYRIDGVLHEIMRSPKQIQSAILSRLKLMAGMDIAENRKPQDGRCALSVKGRGVDFRVATLPTVYGERVVLRILEKGSITLKLEEMGFLPDSLKLFSKAFNKPYGSILVTGPTGSGKSTTLYATLNVLNIEGKNIVTIEDPVEYRLKGINQVQINSKAGLTFARGLRAVLRTSPDIVMVGEIRDRETAQIAIEAALTGHLVLSTLHTNDAPGAISRLTEMGIAPFLVSSAITCVQAQRLARRLCSECKEAYEPPEELLDRYKLPKDGSTKLYKAIGCSKCNDTGYKGRIGLYEVMLMDEEIEKLTVERATSEEIKKVAIAHGMKTLQQDGIEKVKLGLTSLEEVLRVTV